MINVLSEQLERVWYDGLCFQWLTTLNFYSFGDAGVGLGLARAETMRMIIIQYICHELLSDCLRHPIRMAGTETIWELHTLPVINS